MFKNIPTPSIFLGISKDEKPLESLRNRLTDLAKSITYAQISYSTYEIFYSSLLNITEWLFISASNFTTSELKIAVSEIEDFAMKIGGVNSPSQMIYNHKIREVKNIMMSTRGINIVLQPDEIPVLTLRSINSTHNDSLTTLHWHYAHCELENIGGYDIMAYDESKKDIIEPLIGNGVYDVQVKVEKTGELFECTLFSWKNKNNGCKGLIVKKGDLEGYKDAESKYNSRAENI